MSFLDALLGRTRVPPARTEPLFALSTAIVTLESELGWHPGGRAGVVLRPAEDSLYAEAQEETGELVTLAAREMQGQVEIRKDEYGYQWLLFADPDWEDLVALAHMAGQNLTEQGAGERLLAAVFRLVKDDRVLYLIFNYKRGAFYPFIPLADKEKERDNAQEMRLAALMEKELPWEKDYSRWYPLWGCPV
ncbi:PspA-associated protein PspAB [Moorella sp. Hama-1]|uniref:PspA-associated protein PspAB n=1 Tax=Moorella sp. Hama-1 TaxID=2138101 RepID=UPI000D641A57|nr:hypothetical protein [Moorella sp. Hama-1]MDN5362633.1 hypothetical protein [Moorella sp. (in: firmicutes)]BCV20738.1 hypothetical protein hamaS1_08070 [Moorella sp. Hama-1]